MIPRHVLHHLMQIYAQMAMQILFQIQETYRRRKLRRRRQTRLRIQHQTYQSWQFLQQLFLNINLRAPCFVKIRHRTIGAKKRSTHWWYNDALKEFDDLRWIENFRMSKGNFLKICKALEATLKPHHKAFNRVLSVQQKVAISLYKLASCAEYRVVGNQFGVHKSTVHCVLHEFCEAVTKVLMPKMIKMPNEVECREIAASFEHYCKIPFLIGAIDGSHIPITAPADGYRDFVNRKGWASVVLQAVVDDRGLFRDITCQNPGSSHDASVFANSALFQNMDFVIPQDVHELESVFMQYMILGDAAYPLLISLLTPFRSASEGPEECFNVYHSNGRICVEQAFGRLKGRWRCLLKRLDVDCDFVPLVVATCCTLHNFLETNNERYIAQWNEALIEAEFIYPQPGTEHHQSRRINLDADKIRHTLKRYLWEKYEHRISSLRNAFINS